MTSFALDKLDIALLRRLAGSRSYARGEEYFNAEAVERIVETDGKITATVHCMRKIRDVMVRMNDVAACPRYVAELRAKH